MITDLLNKISNTSISVAMYRDICVLCHENVDRAEIEKCVGQLTGEKIVKTTSVRGEEVCICKECISKVYEQLKKNNA